MGAAGHQSDATKIPKCQIHCAECSLHFDNNDCSGNPPLLVTLICSKVQFFPAAEWKTIKGKFFMVSGANLSCSCPRSPNGIAPFCHVGNGCADVVLVKHSNIFNNLRLLLRLSSSIKTLVIWFFSHFRVIKFGVVILVWPSICGGAPGAGIQVHGGKGKKSQLLELWRRTCLRTRPRGQVSVGPFKFACLVVILLIYPGFIASWWKFSQRVQRAQEDQWPLRPATAGADFSRSLLSEAFIYTLLASFNNSIFSLL
jgi:hypothetical protein